MTTQMTVLGLGQIGTSIGLALAGQKDQLLRIGNDRDVAVARQAEKMGAFDKTKVNLHDAVENSEIVILALPVDEIEETLKIIAPDLKPGAVVIDTSPVKVAISEIASHLLGPDRHFVTLSASINPAYLIEDVSGTEAAHADLFKDSLMVVTTPPGAHAGAIQLATDLATLLGGKPFFADQYEADGLSAAAHTLPQLLAAALLHAVTDQPGWREGRKLAGKQFAEGTLPIVELDENKSLGLTALLNRENTLRVLDDAVASLRELRGMIDRKEEEALHEYLKQAQESRELWMKQRFTSNWDTNPAANQQMPRMGDVFGRLIGLKPKKDEKK